MYLLENYNKISIKYINKLFIIIMNSYNYNNNNSGIFIQI
jgi:hypothetical protein